MTSLRELQQAFVDGALFGYSARICQLIAPNGLAPERRLGIYRNNAREGFLNTLEATFTVLTRLAGRDWLRQTGREYMRRRPSRSGNLHYVGERFAAFLDDQLRGSEYRYFSDVARLEWAYQEVLVAADHPTFELGTLASVSADDYPRLRFTTHPAVRLVSSAYPILAIWKDNQGDDLASHEPVRLDAGASRVLVVRRDDHVELRELSEGDFALLSGFAQFLSLADASEAALGADANLDLGAALGRLVGLNVLVDFSVAELETLPASAQADLYPTIPDPVLMSSTRAQELDARDARAHTA
jgi:hypothetical protein